MQAAIRRHWAPRRKRQRQQLLGRPAQIPSFLELNIVVKPLMAATMLLLYVRTVLFAGIIQDLQRKSPRSTIMFYKALSAEQCYLCPKAPRSCLAGVAARGMTRLSVLRRWSLQHQGRK